MNSKINGVAGGPPRIDSTQRTSGLQPGAKDTRPAGLGNNDSVSLTDSAQLMVRLEKVLDDLPVVDRERVDTIKQAIAEGNYSVNADRVASEVLRMELNLNIR